MFAVLLPDIYEKMLQKIANSKQQALAENEKIEMRVDILNQLTTKNKYSFESFLKSESEA